MLKIFNTNLTNIHTADKLKEIEKKTIWLCFLK